MRTKAPRADRLDKIRDFAIILYRNGGEMSKDDFIKDVMKSIQPPQLGSWSISNLREYIAALIYLKMAILIRRKKLYLTEAGRKIAREDQFGIDRLNDVEKTIFNSILFQNKRFQSFLGLFTHGKIPSNQHEFVTLGDSIKLKYSEFETELDRREVQDIFKSWALSTEIIEWNSTLNRFFSVERKFIPLQDFFTSVQKPYKEVEDRTIRRAEIYKIKDIVCYEYRIPSQQFYESLIELSRKYPEKVHLELASIMMMPIQKFRIEMAKKFGIVTEKGIYYYIKIT